MPREKPPGWVDPPADHGGSTRRADVILGKMLVNRNLNRMLMRRAQADLVADAVAEPGAARPEFKLVFDTRGRSTFKVRCAFDSEKTAQGYGFDDASSLFTLEGRPRTATRRTTRRPSSRRPSVLADDESGIRPATSAAATLRASRGSRGTLIRPQSAGSSVAPPPPSRPSTATMRARPSTATLRRGTAAGGGAEAARQRRETLHRERDDAVRAAVAKKAAACGAEGNVVEYRKVKRARQERWLAVSALAASGNNLKRIAAVVMKRRETDAGWRVQNRAAHVLGRNWRSQRIRRHVYWSARLVMAVRQNLRLLLQLRIGRKRRAARRMRWFFGQTKLLRLLRYASRKLHGAARVLQRGTRDRQAATKVRLAVLRLLWLRVEDDLDAAKTRKLKRESLRASRGSWDGHPEYIVGIKSYHEALKCLRNEEPWDRLQTKLEKNREKLVLLRIMDHADFGRTQDNLLDSADGAERAPYSPIREQGIRRLLNELRAEHAVRYSTSRDRKNYAQQTKTFSRASAARVLALYRGPRARVPVPVPVDRKLLMWPVMNFYRPPPKHRRVASALNPEQWDGRPSLLLRVRDRVLLSRTSEAFTIFGGMDASAGRKAAAARASGFTKRFKDFTGKSLLAKFADAAPAPG